MVTAVPSPDRDADDTLVGRLTPTSQQLGDVHPNDPPFGLPGTVPGSSPEPSSTQAVGSGDRVPPT